MTDTPMAPEPCLTATVQPVPDPRFPFLDLLKQGVDGRIDEMETVELAGEGWL